MTGQLRRAWTIDDVRSLLRASEGRQAPGRPTLGHSGSMHVSVTRDQLKAHSDRPHGDIELATAFLCFEDQVRAATVLLNDAGAGQPALGFLDQGRGNLRVAIETNMPPMVVRCATRERNWTQPLNAARIVLDKGSHGFGLHVHTLFPLLVFNGAGPNWRRQ